VKKEGAALSSALKGPEQSALTPEGGLSFGLRAAFSFCSLAWGRRYGFPKENQVFF